MTERQNTAFRLSAEELALLDRIAAKEERNRSDVMRRALLAYAEKLGVTSAAKWKRPK
jgi:predicted transcriptional regulator